ncbi:lytic transglycosylase domain-containing protein [Lysobacter sp. CFH 32150]|uniref:lytic transglycosylase domain-containing protein n=1 Tax=Lysobacter sp. CFH 32150 TaxID=2927128 RepID=UPI001FA7EDFC|nr:lytic transglycosylase domain-containing protein [Lysobacter sp. CFH 32150]MCI4567533.1 lytic transglycosylase domain-containing protein [Lysobacter sp. CFH 32150]
MAGLLALAVPAALDARTVYRCVRNGTVSLSTSPEPGSRCVARHFDDNAAKVPNLWGQLGTVKGTLYERQQDGRTVYGTRKLPGSKPVLAFTVETPKSSSAHVGLGRIGKPRLDMFAWQFKAAAKKTGVDDAWLRAIAHAESGFDAAALSPKGAQGVMQLMPDVVREYGVANPYSSSDSIDGGARYLKALMRHYKGDLELVAAAYNAGIGAVAHFGGVPPYAETQVYVEKVQALYARYRAAMGRPLRSAETVANERPTQSVP